MLRLESSPPGAVLGYAGVEVAAPAGRRAAIGFRPTVSAPAELVSEGRRYTFDRWSDGGARLHGLVVPDHDLTLTAHYRPPAAAPGSTAAARSLAPAFIAPPAARVVVDTSRTRVTRRVRGRVLGATGPVGVRVALRLRRSAKGCRWWRKPLGRLSRRPTSCDRPAWMRATVDGAGRWSLDLRRKPPPGRFVILTRLQRP